MVRVGRPFEIGLGGKRRTVRMRMVEADDRQPALAGATACVEMRFGVEQELPRWVVREVRSGYRLDDCGRRAEQDTAALVRKRRAGMAGDRLDHTRLDFNGRSAFDW